MNNYFWRFLGSMKLAIYILVLLGIASIIGTILQQNQTYNDYLLKFGAFWFDIFLGLGIFNIYNSFWFLLIIFFLICSISFCLYLNTPIFWKEMQSSGLSLRKSALLNTPLCVQWENSTPIETNKIIALLKTFNYKSKEKKKGEQTLISATKGRYQKFGYLFTHLAMIIIFIGGFLDSNINLALKEITGDLYPETQSININDIPIKSKLGINNFSFRGNVNLPENKTTTVAFLPYKNGYLVQNLPFQLELLDFKIEHYDTGQPKSFESSLILRSEELEKPIKKTISVNNPLTYKNYTIYQSSFSDGGSKLDLEIVHFTKKENFEFNASINEEVELSLNNTSFTLEFDDFRLFNVQNLSKEKQKQLGKKFKNIGPSIIFKLRNLDGSAIEFLNYQNPIEINNSYYFISGIKKSIRDDFVYLSLPADKQFSHSRFFRWINYIKNQEKIYNLIYSTSIKNFESKNSLINKPLTKEEIKNSIAEKKIEATFYSKLVHIFANGGYQELYKFFDFTEKEKNITIDKQTYIEELNHVLGQIYNYILVKEYNKETLTELDEFDKKFFLDAIKATDSLINYKSPFWLKINSFKHIQSSGLQITKSPGLPLVYFGSLLLVIGIFLLFYVKHNRIWILIEKEKNNWLVTIAGKNNKNRKEFSHSFYNIINNLKKINL